MPGLDAILGLLSTIQTVERDLNSGEYTHKALSENAGKIVEMNVGQLYNQGVNSLGIDISTYAPYAPLTIKLKQEKGQPYDRVTLRDTGDFHRSFEVVFNPTSFYITATDWKTQDLVDKYGDKIFGLTPENISELGHVYVLPSVIKQVRTEIFG